MYDLHQFGDVLITLRLMGPLEARGRKRRDCRCVNEASIENSNEIWTGLVTMRGSPPQRQICIFFIGKSYSAHIVKRIRFCIQNVLKTYSRKIVEKLPLAGGVFRKTK